MTAIAAPPPRKTIAVAIVGAGPYGLSIAAHLQAQGTSFQMFGRPMETWRTHMPRGMHLKSEGFASNLYDADGEFTLKSFCESRRIPYADVGVPVSLATFTAYGLAFQERFIPDADRRNVVDIASTDSGFVLTLEDGAVVLAERVVMAAGISHYAWLPPELEAAPRAFVTHASENNDLSRFRDRRVTVVGAGASAIDMAALLHEAGAVTQLVARTPRLSFHSPPRPDRSLYERVRYPQSGLGPNARSFAYSNFPDAFSFLPAERRAAIVHRALGPAACWFTKEQIVGKVDTVLDTSIEAVDVVDGAARLHVRDASGNARELRADHVIAGTGYRVDLERLTFLSGALRDRIRTFAGSPVLSREFESSVPGLHFVGISAAQTFGPVLRFAFGARFAAKRISRALRDRSTSRR